MLTHVLVPLDGSPLAEKALRMAERMLPQNAKITLLISIQKPEPPVYAYPSPAVVEEIAADQDVIRNAESQAHAYLEHIATNLKLNGYQVDIEIEQGEPAELIVERAVKLGVEAIIMSTHGRSGLSRILFGSVTLNVLNDAPCPVVVVPNREQVRNEEPKPATDLGLDVAPNT